MGGPAPLLPRSIVPCCWPMDPTLRARFNADFSAEKYEALVRCIQQSERWPADFRISETPLFLTPEFTEEVVRAAEGIVAETRTPEFARHAEPAIPPGPGMCLTNRVIRIFSSWTSGSARKAGGSRRA